MPEVVIRKSIEIEIDKVFFHELNPNEMTNFKFNELVKTIKEEGFRDPVRVVSIPEGKYKGQYKLIAGENRVKAAKVLGMTKVPAYVETFDDDEVKFKMVKDNVLRGKMSAKKFMTLYSTLNTKYGKEIIEKMMAFEPGEIDRFIVEIKKTLTPELAAKLDEARLQIKTIDDLSTVLNRLFTEYGNTLDSNYMIFDFGGKMCLWVRCDKETWSKVQEVTKYCEDNKKDINLVFKDILNLFSEGQKIKKEA